MNLYSSLNFLDHADGEEHSHEEGQAHEDGAHEEGHSHSEDGREILSPATESHEGHSHESTGNLGEDYWNLLTDPSHVLVELTFLLIGEVLIALILLPLVKRYFNFRLDKAHADLDREHGITHDPNTGEAKKKD